MRYLVAYGHAVRGADVGTPEQAMKDAYGLVDQRQMTVCRDLPKRAPQKAHRDLVIRLALAHFQRTGSVLGGCEKEPGIVNVHWTTCQLCLQPMLSPKPFPDGHCCPACESLLVGFDQGDKSIATIRKELKIKTVHSSSFCDW